MNLTYRFAFDSKYCKTLIARFYRQRPLLIRLPVQFGIPILIIEAIWLFRHASAISVTSLAAAGVICIAGAALLAQAVKLAIFRKLKRNREFGVQVTVVLAGEGVTASSGHGERSLAWSGYPKAVRYADGILLMRGGSIRWLPDDALESGNAEEATSLVRSKSRLRFL